MAPMPEALELTLEAPPSVRVGAGATFVLRMRNRGREPLTVYLRGRTITYDFHVYDAAGVVVWQRLFNQVVPAIIQAVTLEPDGHREFRETWSLETNGGAALAPGHYSVVGQLPNDQPRPYQTGAEGFDIVR